MAKRICFIPTFDNKLVFEEEIEFKYYTGFAISQKQKSIESLHEQINKTYPNKKILEISSKSKVELGIKLSAFNLQLYSEEVNKVISVESIFQSSKVFEKGGPYKDILNKTSLEAKKDERIRNSGELKYFDYEGEKWGLNPKTMFYDYIYIKALLSNKELSNKMLEYDCFTDIEFNHTKSLNCQARSAAMFISLKKQDKINLVMNNIDLFKELYGVKNDPIYINQMSLFD